MSFSPRVQSVDAVYSQNAPIPKDTELYKLLTTKPSEVMPEELR